MNSIKPKILNLFPGRRCTLLLCVVCLTPNFKTVNPNIFLTAHLSSMCAWGRFLRFRNIEIEGFFLGHLLPLTWFNKCLFTCKHYLKLKFYTRQFVVDEFVEVSCFAGIKWASGVSAPFQRFRDFDTILTSVGCLRGFRHHFKDSEFSAPFHEKYTCEILTKASVPYCLNH